MPDLTPDEITALVREMDKRFPNLRLKSWEAEFPVGSISLTELINRAAAALEALARDNAELRRERAIGHRWIAERDA